MEMQIWIPNRIPLNSCDPDVKLKTPDWTPTKPQDFNVSNFWMKIQIATSFAIDILWCSHKKSIREIDVNSICEFHEGRFIILEV